MDHRDGYDNVDCCSAREGRRNQPSVGRLIFREGFSHDDAGTKVYSSDGAKSSRDGTDRANVSQRIWECLVHPQAEEYLQETVRREAR